MKFLFRVDASVTIGSGHVMRCLTLAAALRAGGAHCHFVCRQHDGHLVELVRLRGFEVTELAASPEAVDDVGGPAHATWLGCSWQIDAQQTLALVAAWRPDWLVVDHYALDRRWERVARDGAARLLIIDDLADRAHACDLLVDQNLGRRAEDYRGLVPARCSVLAGPAFAMLRPEFARLRDASLARWRGNVVRHILVNMGGVDLPNATGEVLTTLRDSALPADCRLSVVMGLKAPWIAQVRDLAAQLPWEAEVLVNISDMAERMAASDLAIGAAGSTSWERCCLGLPTLIVILAANQEPGGAALRDAGAAALLGGVGDIRTALPFALREIQLPGRLEQAHAAAAALTDGLGISRILQALEV